jgi:hypothetical protein
MMLLLEGDDRWRYANDVPRGSLRELHDQRDESFHDRTGGA